ncbi:MAG: hypothetical protein Q4P23_15915 [Micrococcaceae bacterium]|nr:hypothetical protein [Micrococcaceae bacterium]
MSKDRKVHNAGSAQMGEGVLGCSCSGNQGAGKAQRIGLSKTHRNAASTKANGRPTESMRVN